MLNPSGGSTMQSRDSSWKEASRTSPSISLLYGPLTVCRFVGLRSHDPGSGTEFEDIHGLDRSRLSSHVAEVSRYVARIPQRSHCRCACIFLGGLSLGYTLFGIVSTRLVDRSAAASKPARLFLTYGAIKAAIGVYALLFPQLFRAAQSSSLRESWALAVGSQR